jgi:hypothetical protein
MIRSGPVVLHGVQHVLHPPVRLDGWPDGKAQTRLVFIVKDIEKAAIEELFRAFTDPITGGASTTDKTLSLCEVDREMKAYGLKKCSTCQKALDFLARKNCRGVHRPQVRALPRKPRSRRGPRRWVAGRR